MEYEYVCNLCGKKFTLLQSMKEDAIKFHKENNESKCNGEVNRVITGGTGFILKGDGWTTKYHTRTGKNLKKVDNALKQMNIEDESEGWSKHD